ncbi:FHA domain-containing protein, partial [Myxococcota bacterium]
GVLTRAQIEQALDKQRTMPGRPKLGETILEMGLTTEEVILKVLSHAMNLPSIDLSNTTATGEAVETLPVEEAERNLMIPVCLEKAGRRRRLVVAMADPTNIKVIDELQFRTGMIVRPVVTTATQIRRAIAESYTREPDLAQPPELQRSDEVTWTGVSPTTELAVAEDVAEFQVVSGPAMGRNCRLAAGKAIDFGRGGNVDITIPDMRMSRRHFVVVDAEESFELVDLGSRNGTRVNKQPVKRAALRNGDTIQAGDTIIQVTVLVER